MQKYEEIGENKTKKNTSKSRFKSTTQYHEILIPTNYELVYCSEYISRPCINLPSPHMGVAFKRIGNKGE